jgi:hypothetical protein
MSLFTGNLRRSAGAGESFARITQFFERKPTVVRSRIYPRWDASPVDTTFEHAYVNILGWLCASGEHMTDALPHGLTQERTRWHKPP